MIFVNNEFVGCRIHKTSNQLTNSGDQAIVAFSGGDIVVFDTHNFFNGSKIRIPDGQKGFYLVQGCVEWVQNSTGERLAFLTHFNKADVEQPVKSKNQTLSIASDHTCASISLGPISMLDGDYINLYGRQNTGGTLEIRCKQPFRTFLSIIKVGN